MMDIPWGGEVENQCTQRLKSLYTEPRLRTPM